MTNAPEPLDENLREFLYLKEFGRIPRWIMPNDHLPEIPDYLKPKNYQQCKPCP